MKSSQLIAIYLLHALTRTECQIQNATCGLLDLSDVDSRLTNAFNATHHWPWHAAMYHQLNESDRNYRCGGTLISARLVLTAAHCLFVRNVQLNADEVTISLGRLHLDKIENSTQWFGASEIFIHPNYNKTEYDSDIAIISLSDDAILNKYVQPICLWKSDFSEVVGKTGTVVGWGLTQNGTLSTVLQQGHFPVQDFFTCVKKDPAYFGQYLTKTNFCGGNANGTALCQGDSGGSITFKEDDGIYHIRGIISLGQAKPNPITQQLECDSMQYAIFTDVAKFLPWITEKSAVIKTFSRDRPEPVSGLPITVTAKTDFSICGQLSPSPMPQSYRAHHWPWHAAIFHEDGESDARYRCGGTIIDSRSILTSAQCVQIDANKISVHLGRLNLGANENNAQTFGVAEIIVNPDFDRETLNNDIAIIKLSTDAIFNSNVRPICLWNSSYTDLSEIVGKSGTVVGWGQTETGQLSNILQNATFSVVGVFTCLRSDHEMGFYLYENNFCAGPRSGTKTCNCDTGGSMTFDENGTYYISGIVSIGQRKPGPIAQKFDCDLLKYPVFTDVAKFLPWIIDNTSGNREEATVEPEKTTAEPEKTSVVAEKTTSAPKKTTVEPEKTTAEPEKTSFAAEKTTSAPKKTIVEPKPTTVTPKKTTVAYKQTTIAPKLTTVTPKQTTIAYKQTTIAPKLTTVTPKQTTIASKQTTVAPNLTTVTPKQTTATPKQTTATPKQTTATPKQTTVVPEPSSELLAPVFGSNFSIQRTTDNENVCTPACTNGGTCISYNFCECLKGFAGEQCQYSVDRCALQKIGFNGAINCTYGSIEMRCKLSCPLGVQFDYPPTEDYVCKFETGTFLPLRVPKCVYGPGVQVIQGTPFGSNYGISDQTTCYPPCMNGGSCKFNNFCECPKNFVGEQCQYSVDRCAPQKLGFNGSVKCLGNSTSTNCRLSCPIGVEFNSPPASVYTCSFHTGIFTPSIVPQCNYVTCQLPCKNGGTCIYRDTCECPKGYVGPQCQYSVDRCALQKIGFNGAINCTYGSTEMRCTLSCSPGVQFDYPPTEDYVCKFETGTFLPLRVPKCVYGEGVQVIQRTSFGSNDVIGNQATCNPPCMNGGSCIFRDQCQCTENYRGLQCQYHKERCSLRKTGFNGGYRCSGSYTESNCAIDCPFGTYFEFLPAANYLCRYETGRFEPSAIPKCIAPEGVQIVPST